MRLSRGWKQELLSSLDPRAPLVLDTRELGRRPGAHRRGELSVQAPTELGNEVVGVPSDSTLELDYRLEAVMEGVLVSGTARARVAGECVRCLEALDRELAVEFQELYVYAGTEVDEDEDDETHQLEDDDLLDLEPVVRDAVLLALPFQPMCSEDCPGLCSVCGARLADDPEHQHDEGIDPRWAALANLAGPDRTEHDQDAGAPGSTKE